MERQARDLQEYLDAVDRMMATNHARVARDGPMDQRLRFARAYVASLDPIEALWPESKKVRQFVEEPAATAGDWCI